MVLIALSTDTHGSLVVASFSILKNKFLLLYLDNFAIVFILALIGCSTIFNDATFCK